MKTDREELEGLRVSLARIAHIAKADVPQLEVTNKVYTELCDLAHTKERGWNALAADICDKIEELNTELFYLSTARATTK